MHHDVVGREHLGELEDRAVIIMYVTCVVVLVDCQGSRCMLSVVLFSSF